MPKTERRKRPRALQACKVCRVRKNRCSEDQPCTYCVEHDLECTYSPMQRDKRSKPAEPISAMTNIQSEERPYGSPAIDPDRRQQQDPLSTRSALDINNLIADQSTIGSQDSTSDVIDTNPHTNNLEFYGGSSSVAFLRHVESMSNSNVAGSVVDSSERSLVSLLHNIEFTTTSVQRVSFSEVSSQAHADRFYFRVAQRFLDAYFTNIHYIQPLFDEESFLSRCESLWFNDSEPQPLSFVALYYATLSLGSLVMTSYDWDKNGSSRFTWGRKLLSEALNVVDQLGSATDIEMVQCYYMISKVCQHELNPHGSEDSSVDWNQQETDGPESFGRTLLDHSVKNMVGRLLPGHTSFALGRPDSLGPDEYHTQSLPATPESDEGSSSPSSRALEIVPCMVELSRIMRKASLRLYAAPCPIEERVGRVEALETDLKRWQKDVPAHLRLVDRKPAAHLLKPRTSAAYVNKQAIVLQLRYLNLRMIIHGAFMSFSEAVSSTHDASIRESRRLCFDSACRAIDLIYDTFSNHSFFQTWWYNATYTLFAVSVLLTAVFQNCASTEEALDDIFGHIDRAIAVLQAMDECVVARNAICIIRRSLSRAKGVQQQPTLDIGTSSTLQESGMERSTCNSIDLPQGVELPNLISAAEAGEASYGTVDDGLNWLDPDSNPFDNCQQALFWTTWAQEVEGLGT